MSLAIAAPCLATPFTPSDVNVVITPSDVKVVTLQQAGFESTPPPLDDLEAVLNGTITDARVTGTTTVVPEPATLLLLGSGLVVLSVLFRKRLSKNALRRLSVSRSNRP